jgi:hypothetical protein
MPKRAIGHRHQPAGQVEGGKWELKWRETRKHRPWSKSLITTSTWNTSRTGSEGQSKVQHLSRPFTSSDAIRYLNLSRAPLPTPFSSPLHKQMPLQGRKARSNVTQETNQLMSSVASGDRNVYAHCPQRHLTRRHGAVTACRSPCTPHTKRSMRCGTTICRAVAPRLAGLLRHAFCSMQSCRQFELGVGLPALGIVVEEIRIESGLKDPRNPNCKHHDVTGKSAGIGSSTATH